MSLVVCGPPPVSSLGACLFGAGHRDGQRGSRPTR